MADACECGNETSGNFLTSCKPVSCSRRTLHHGVSKYCYAHIQNVLYCYAYIQNVVYCYAHIQNVVYCYAHIQNLLYCYAHIQNVVYCYAQIQNVLICYAHIQNVLYCYAYIQNLLYCYAHIQNVVYCYAQIQNVLICYAHIQNVLYFYAHCYWTIPLHLCLVSECGWWFIYLYFALDAVTQNTGRNVECFEGLIKVLSYFLLGETEDNREKFSQASPCCRWNSYRAPTEFKSEVSQLKLSLSVLLLLLLLLLLLYDMYVSCHRPFLPGTSLEPAVIPTAQASSFTQQYFPYYAWRSKYSCLL